MPYIQNQKLPTRKIMQFTNKDFRGGLNNRSELLNLNEASDLMNMAFYDDTIMEKRHGFSLFDNVKLPDKVTFIDRYRPYVDADKILRATDTELWVDGVKLCDVAGRVVGVNFSGHYFFVDGAKLRVYGKFAQSSTTYEKVIGTPINDYVLLDVVNPPSGYVPLDNTNKQGVRQIDYTNKQIWYEPCTNELNDAFKGTNVIPDKPSLLTVHHRRLFVSGVTNDDDNVFIADLDNPYYFPPTLPLQPTPNADKNTCLVVYDDCVIVGRNYEIYYISGDTNRTDIQGANLFQLHKMNTHTGIPNQNCAMQSHNFLFFMGSDGQAYSLSNVRGGAQVMNTSLLSKNIDILKDPINLTLSDVKNASSAFYNDIWFISMGDKILIYSYKLMAWSIWNHLNVTAMTVLDDQFLLSDIDGDTICQSDDFLDKGVPFNAYWSSMHYDMDDANSFKQFREFFIVAHTFDAYKSDIFVKFGIDYVDVNLETKITNQRSVWGKSIFGDRFITRNINASVPFILGRRGRNIRITISNGYTPIAPVATLADLDKVQNKTNGTLVFVTETNSYHLYMNYAWTEPSMEDLNQPMRVYQINGEFEFKGKR